jgi:hypothetical protein
VRELCDRDDDVDDERQDCADPVDHEASAPVRLFVRDVMLGHPRLRHRERREHADRVQRDEPVDLGARDDHESRSRDGEGDDPVREDEPVASLRELPRHEVVAGVEGGQPREVGKRRVRGQHEDEHRRRL